MKRTAFITGSSRGIGFGFCQELISRGWTVFASARNPGCERLNDLTRSHPERCRPLELDVQSDRSINAAAGEVLASGLHLDLLVHNAGIFAGGEEGLAGLDRSRMRGVFETNVFGPLMLTRALQPVLRQPGAVVTALTSGKWGDPSPPKPNVQYSYGISKQALCMALHCLKGDLEPLGVTVRGIGPGFVKTDMTAGSPVEPPLCVAESVNNMLAELLPTY